jgi:hypothetical protein
MKRIIVSKGRCTAGPLLLEQLGVLDSVLTTATFVVVNCDTISEVN